MVDQILQELEREGFCLIPQFLDPAALKTFNEFFETHKTEFLEARVGTKGNRMRDESIRGDYTYWLDPLNIDQTFLPIFSFLNELRDRINARFFLGLQEYECHLAYYPPGTFYNKHLDRFKKDSSRRLTFIFYLNQEWKVEDGGELVVYDQQGNVHRTIYPMPGTLVTFLSDEFPHEVKAGKKERRSFTGWMHTKIIY